MTSTNNDSNANKNTSQQQDLTSILSQVQNLQGDRERLMWELEEAKEKMNKLQVGLVYVCLMLVDACSLTFL